MAVRATWDASADRYVEMYRYGLLAKQWQAERRRLIEEFARRLKDDRDTFAEFFVPGQREYTDRLDWDLKSALDAS
jgi:hypothetical protein